MNLTVVQISEPSEFGNVLIKARHSVEVSTPLGKISRSQTFYIFVEAEGVTVKVGDSVDLDMDLFVVVERPWTNPETGEEMLLKYLYLK